MVINIGIACIFISLSLLYLILFIFYSRRKENLYYFIFTFFISIVFSSNMIPRFFPSDFFQRTFWAIMNGLSVFFIFWSYLGFLYSIFYKKMPRLFWIATAVLLPVIALIFVNVNDKTIEFIYMSYIVLATLEGLRIIIMAIRRGEENAWVIGAGVIVFVCFIAFLFVIGIIDSQVDISILLTIFMIGLLCIPISMSVYLARTIASTNENLIQQLETVKELSQKELEHQKQQAEYERRMKELEEARQLQLSMLPKVIPQLPNLDIAVHMQTATEVGGDYYDFEKTADGMLTIVVGDATGHGMKAGTVVTASKSLFNALAEKEDIPATLREMARSIKRMEFHLLSMCMMMIKTDGKTLRLSSAGMPPALLYRADTGVVEELLTKGMPLGTFPEFDYQLRETNLAKGDTILLMSDGMPELFNQKKEMFGYDRISSLFKSVAGETVQKIIDRLVQAGREWIEGEDPQDDITFLAFKVK